MSAATQKVKDQKMAADLIARGYPHGKRATKGLTNVPSLSDIGSAAYRRLKAR
jgi:hypothetical protein